MIETAIILLGATLIILTVGVGDLDLVHTNSKSATGDNERDT